ncbi:hypothetical protein SAMN04487897_102177 [Paenibacillus sp. yr247]|uniref:hypothetical protein n=1 Tax=Paenibacillus sp. yr247 TaxID=1761880 RepID=UPI00088FFA78|nr:hypothetical protein [Paenibacillus sp. yr247]SDN21769.1 hypothetical protein SAMN04487897_102177 [Paenibacillus sp. yr247]
MKRSKWRKWQIGIVMGVLLFYLFQEVKASPQFLAAVTAASAAKQKIVPVTVQKEHSNNRMTDNTDPRRRNHDRVANGATGSSQSQLKPHTRSQAS